jgi:hypothetical protein
MAGELQFHGQATHAPQHTDMLPAAEFGVEHKERVQDAGAADCNSCRSTPRSTRNSLSSLAVSGHPVQGKPLV